MGLVRGYTAHFWHDTFIFFESIFLVTKRPNRFSSLKSAFCVRASDRNTPSKIKNVYGHRKIIWNDETQGLHTYQFECVFSRPECVNPSGKNYGSRNHILITTNGYSLLYILKEFLLMGTHCIDIISTNDMYFTDHDFIIFRHMISVIKSYLCDIFESKWTLSRPRVL